MSKLLVLAETDGTKVLDSTLPAITFAQQWSEVTGAPFQLLVLVGSEARITGSDDLGYGSQAGVLVERPYLAHPTADIVAAVTASAAKQVGATSIAAPSSTFGRDIMPRMAALLDLPMLSDVMGVEKLNGHLAFRRPMYAGNVIATVEIEGDEGVLTVRGTAFGKPQQDEKRRGFGAVHTDVDSPTRGTKWIGLQAGEQKRPELTSARVVVSGGRPLRDAATFERLVGGLADKLGGAVGATRAAVDSGIAPNELQVGQTGKAVAPELYIAAGISGSVQHLAGMKDSKVIVAINTDPDAPIFEVADYGLVMDLHQALPELIEKL